MVVFKDWIFSLFPRYFLAKDTDLTNGRGIFQRFIEIFGDEIDNEMKDYITDYMDKQDLLTTDDKYLVYLAWFLGNPPNTLSSTTGYDDARYRRMLSYLVEINKNKGTVKGYDLLFAILGVTVTITELALIDANYDSTTEHYDGSVLHYDMDCPQCSYYTLDILDPDGNCPQLQDITVAGSFVMDIVRNMILYVEPINAKVTTITYNGGTPYAPLGWVLTTGTWNNSLRWKNTAYYKNTP